MAFQVLSVQSWPVSIIGSQLPFLHTWNSHPAFVTSDAERLGLCTLLMHLPDTTSKRGAGRLIKGILTHLSLCPSDPMICHKSKLPLRTSSTICLSTRPITLSGPRSRPGTGLASVSLWLKELFLGMCFNIVYCFPGLITGLGIFPGEGKGNPLQYSQLENSMDRGTWQAIVHGVTKSQTRLST